MTNLITGALAHSNTAVLLCFTAASIAILAIKWFHSWCRLRHIPGPFLASLSIVWLLRRTVAGRLDLDLQEVSCEYGSLARVGLNELATDDPEIIRRMWAVRSPYKRAAFYEAVKFDPGRDNLATMRDDVAHSALKARMAAGYAGKENESLESSVDKQIEGFVSLIERKYVSTNTVFRPVDFARIAQYFTLDVIGEIAFGKSFGYLKTDSDIHDYIRTTEKAMPFMMVVCVMPVLGKIIHSRFLNWIMPSENDKMGFGKVLGVAKEVVEERFGEEKVVRRDMLGSFVAHGLTKEECRSEVVLQIIAGSDTTATAMRSTLLHLMTSPTAYAKLQAEIDASISKGTISTPVTDSESRKLPYLQAVIKEGLRIFPPITGLMLKVVPKEGDVLNGIFVPGGTEIGYCMLGIQHSKKIYGQDASIFRPDRWLEASPDALREMNNTVELVFGHGKWFCAGRSVAALELNKIFVELIRRFDFSLVNPKKPWNHYNAGVQLLSNLNVVITERSQTR